MIATATLARVQLLNIVSLSLSGSADIASCFQLKLVECNCPGGNVGNPPLGDFEAYLRRRWALVANVAVPGRFVGSSNTGRGERFLWCLCGISNSAVGGRYDLDWSSAVRAVAASKGLTGLLLGQHVLLGSSMGSGSKTGTAVSRWTAVAVPNSLLRLWERLDQRVSYFKDH